MAVWLGDVWTDHRGHEHAGLRELIGCLGWEGHRVISSPYIIAVLVCSCTVGFETV